MCPDKNDKASAMAVLQQRAQEAHPRGDFVFGEGAPDASLVIVGEAPGEEEARAGRPFVGAAGQVLNDLLREAGIDRQRIWITNVVKERPTKTVGGRLVNRPPRVSEVRSDLPWLQEQLAIIQPAVVLSLGNVAASALIHPDFRMNAEHGRWFPGPGEARSMATFHPAWILRQIGPDHERALALVRADLAKVKAALDSLSTD